MFIYQNVFETYGGNKWKGVALPTPFFSNLYMPFNQADNLEFTDVALNHLLIQRDDVSIWSTPQQTVPIRRSPANIGPFTISKRNEFTEYNGDMNGTTEGGDLSFGGEAIEAVVIRRSDSRSKFHIWEDIAIIPVTTASLYTLDKIIYDPYVEHGITYQYAIQPVGGIGRGAQYETLRNMAVYDDIWLIGSDTKQLMMGYNPVVSGYRYIVKDTAVETIGSKYPYVVRNANVGYTQFNFSCTITAHMNIVDGKEVFTPFKDIEVVDEYKDIIVGEGGSGSTGNQEIVVERPKPVLPGKEPTATFAAGARFRSNQRAEDSTNKLFYEVALNKTAPMKIMEQSLTGRVMKVELPIALIEAGGIINLVQEATKVGKLEQYNNWVNGYTWNDGAGTEVVHPPHNWIPAFVDELYVVDYTKPEYDVPLGDLYDIPELRKNSFSLKNEVLEAEIHKRVEAAVSKKEEGIFDPAYPSSPSGSFDRDGIISNATVVNSDNEYMIEREFRRRAMEFLHDGHPKIFKSPTEGLLLVKLTDISLTPNTALGRMIYDFSCTCTEIGKVNSETLAKYGFREARGDLLLTPVEIDDTFEAEEVANLYELFGNK